MEYTISFEQNPNEGVRCVIVHYLPEDSGQVITLPYGLDKATAKDIAIRVCQIALESLNSMYAKGMKYNIGFPVNGRFPSITAPYDHPFLIRFPTQDNGDSWIPVGWVYGPDDTAITEARDEACLLLNLWIEQIERQ